MKQPLFIVCEDDAPTLKMYRNLLRRKKVASQNVFCFEDGTLAIKLIQDLTSNQVFVLTDFNMPNTNGGLVLQAAIKKGIPYKVIRSGIPKARLSKILEDDYSIADEVVIYDKLDSMRLVSEQIDEFLGVEC